MTIFLAILNRTWPYLLSMGLGAGLSGWTVHDLDNSKYEALQAGHAQELADAQEAGRKALQAQLDQFQATSANNAKVINDLQIQTQQAQADSVRDRELAQRLLNAASKGGTSGHDVPQAGHQSPAASAGQSQGTERLGDLLVGAADESRACARQLNALIAEIRPQL